MVIKNPVTKTAKLRLAAYLTDANERYTADCDEAYEAYHKEITDGAKAAGIKEEEMYV